VSIGATVTVLVNIYRQSRENAAVLLAANPLNDAILPPASRKILSKRFFSIARRISWYPITLFIINVFCLSECLVCWYTYSQYVTYGGTRSAALKRAAMSFFWAFTIPCLAGEE